MSTSIERGRMNFGKPPAHRGFTLLEVLVALSVLALALMAALRAGAAAADHAAELQRRQLADWVAQDRLEEHRARRDWPAPGNHGGETEQGGRRFLWQETVSPTANSQFRRIDIQVRAAEAGTETGSGTTDGPVLARLSGFLVQPRY